MRVEEGPTAIRVSCSLDTSDPQSQSSFDFVPKPDYNEKWHLENKCLFRNQKVSCRNQGDESFEYRSISCVHRYSFRIRRFKKNHCDISFHHLYILQLFLEGREPRDRNRPRERSLNIQILPHPLRSPVFSIFLLSILCS